MSETLNLTSPADVSRLLRRRGLRPKSRWGQNFLIDRNALNKVLEAGDVSPDDGVVEIGAGLGTLTLELAARARHVLAFEIDPDMYAVLTEETAGRLPNVTVLHQDFLKADLEQVVPEVLGDGRYPVVANIPYSVTSPIVVRLLEHRSRFSRIVLMVQKEVADRMVAAPNTSDYGSLTLFIHLHADARKVANVSKRAFLPPPDVDSAIVRLDVLSEPRFPGIDPERYLAVVHAAFQQRRKNLGNALTGPALKWTREQAKAALATAGIDPGRRGESLTPEEFARIAAAWPLDA